MRGRALGGLALLFLVIFAAATGRGGVTQLPAEASSEESRRTAPLALANLPGLVQEPLSPSQVVSAAELIGADRWRAAGFSGFGVRVAVVDTGFAGYEAHLGQSLPAAVRTRSFRADG